jgi:hypothetical protein
MYNIIIVVIGGWTMQRTGEEFSGVLGKIRMSKKYCWFLIGEQQIKQPGNISDLFQFC